MVIEAASSAVRRATILSPREPPIVRVPRDVLRSETLKDEGRCPGVGQHPVDAPNTSSAR